MAIYTVHIPEAASDLAAAAEHAVFVREGFSASAFVFGLLYLLYRRLWLAAGIWVILLVALAAVAAVLHPPAFFPAALLGLMHLYLGVEGPDLRRGNLARRGTPLRDIVYAPDLESAEALFFARRLVPTVVPAVSRPSRAWAPGPSDPAVIGLFPDGSAT